MTLREARQRRNMRQTTLAAKVKVTQATLSRWEAGERTISDQMRVKLALALRMRYETIWGQSEPIQKEPGQ